MAIFGRSKNFTFFLFLAEVLLFSKVAIFYIFLAVLDFGPQNKSELKLKGQARVKIIIANPAVISSNPPEFRDKWMQGI